MLKRFIAITMALALVLSLMCIVPASAEDFASTCWFDAEFKDGSLEDKYGHTMYDFSNKDKLDDYKGPAVEIKEVTDDEGNTFKAAVFGGAGLEYMHKKTDDQYVYISDPDFEKVNTNFTMEIYVKVTNTGWGMIAGTWYENARITAGWGLQMGYAAMHGNIGKANNISVIDATGILAEPGTVQTSLAAGKLRNKWTHFVFVNESGVNALYVNGNLLDRQNAKVPEYACVPNEMNSAFRIGSYRPATDQFSIDMECAYVRLYGRPATQAEAEALFMNKLGPAPSGGGSDPAPSDPTKAPDPSNPTEAPKPGDPTQAPAGPTKAPAEPTKAPENPPKTFDLGIVSIAAMSLSSLVVLKKKKK